MKRIVLAVLVVGMGVVGLACNKDSAGGSGGGAAASGDSIGVKECDDYLEKVDACFAKDPATKAAMAQGTKAQRDAWKAAAATNKDALKVGCKAALDNFATAMPNCK
jgi:hypothetical protein